MENIQIFVEGIADQKFLQDIIKAWYDVKMSLGGYQKDKTTLGQIFNVGGKGVFKNEDKMKVLDTIFKANRINGVRNIFIFDADKFVTESENFIEYSKIHPIEYFLLPDNQADGDLETLLEQIITDENKFMFECWDDFINCLASSEVDKLFLPSRKKKIYTYLELILGEESSSQEFKKERGRNYQNPNHWNLDSPILQNLKQFLDTYFLNNND